MTNKEIYILSQQLINFFKKKDVIHTFKSFFNEKDLHIKIVPFLSKKENFITIGKFNALENTIYIPFNVINSIKENQIFLLAYILFHELRHILQWFALCNFLASKNEAYKILILNFNKLEIDADKFIYNYDKDDLYDLILSMIEDWEYFEEKKDND